MNHVGMPVVLPGDKAAVRILPILLVDARHYLAGLTNHGPGSVHPDSDALAFGGNTSLPQG